MTTVTIEGQCTNQECRCVYHVTGKNITTGTIGTKCYACGSKITFDKEV